MQDHTSPKPRAHIGGEGSQITIFIIKSVGKTLIYIVVHRIRPLPEFLQFKTRGKKLHPDMIVSSQHQAGAFILRQVETAGLLALHSRLI